MNDLTFYIFLFLILATGAGIVMSKKLIHSALFLLLTLITVGAIFLSAGSEFLLVAQILVYIGGILILLLFGIIVTNQMSAKTVEIRNWIPSALLVMGLGVILIRLIQNASANFIEKDALKIASENMDSFSITQIMGMSLMTDYIISLEIIGVLLLITLIGAVTLGGQKQSE